MSFYNLVIKLQGIVIYLSHQRIIPECSSIFLYKGKYLILYALQVSIFGISGFGLGNEEKIMSEKLDLLDRKPTLKPGPTIKILSL